MIKFIAFYKDVNESKSKKLQRRQNLEVFSYRKCLSYLKETFYKFNPKHKFLIATDQHTELPDLGVDVIRDDLSQLLIMEAITRSNTNYVTQNTGKIVLAGADHLICGPIENFFEEDFDLGFWIFPDYDPSHRISVSMTIVLINKNENNEKKINDFFIEREKICLSLEKKERQWFADQKSLSMLLDQEDVIKQYHNNKEQTIFDFRGLKIKFFPYYGKQFLTDVADNGKVEILDNSVLVDFPGHKSKEYLDEVYNIVNKGDT